MKTLFSIIIIFVFAISSFSFIFLPKDRQYSPSFGDEITTSFKVSGVCGMCKDRIEEALYVTGVKAATWDRKSKMLSVTYKPKKISELKLHELVAGVGHDTEKVKAKNEVYKNLPDCCLYRDGVQEHHD
jgi:copper chaperone CopZ